MSYQQNPDAIHQILDRGRIEAQEAATKKLVAVKQRVGLGR